MVLLLYDIFWTSFLSNFLSLRTSDGSYYRYIMTGTYPYSLKCFHGSLQMSEEYCYEEKRWKPFVALSDCNNEPNGYYGTCEHFTDQNDYIRFPAVNYQCGELVEYRRKEICTQNSANNFTHG